jgi:hypothetical protein
MNWITSSILSLFLWAGYSHHLIFPIVQEQTFFGQKTAVQPLFNTGVELLFSLLFF